MPTLKTSQFSSEENDTCNREIFVQGKKFTELDHSFRGSRAIQEKLEVIREGFEER